MNFWTFQYVKISLKPFPGHSGEFWKNSIFWVPDLQSGPKYFFFPWRFWKIFTWAINLIFLISVRARFQLYYKIKIRSVMIRFLYAKILRLLVIFLDFGRFWPQIFQGLIPFPTKFLELFNQARNLILFLFIRYWLKLLKKKDRFNTPCKYFEWDSPEKGSEMGIWGSIFDHFSKFSPSGLNHSEGA